MTKETERIALESAPAPEMPAVRVAGDEAAIGDYVRAAFRNARTRPGSRRPFVTLSFAQSLDGCITAEAGSATRISSASSETVTHQLRAMHAAILVGVDTVLVDDPRLDVRRVAGTSPRPIVVDSRLRTPTTAQLLQRRDVRPLLATTEQASTEREVQLRAAGAEIVRLPAGRRGGVDLGRLLEYLAEESIGSVMVEGGARIITSVIAEGLADLLVVTIAPRFLGGVRAVGLLDEVAAGRRPRLKNVQIRPVASDLILQGEFEWENGAEVR